MPRPRKKKDKIDAFLDIIPAFVGLILLGVFFVPGFRQMLGALFVSAVCLLGIAAVALIGWVIWRRNRSKGGGEFVPPAIRPAVNWQNPPGDRPQVSPIRRKWTRELLCELEWKRFEEVVAAYSRELGYEAKTTRSGADGGVDIQLFRNGTPGPVMIIQCKAWDAYKVGVKPVRELFGVMAADKVANGAFFTTGEFTSEAEEWSRGKNLDLVNGREFMARIGELSPSAQEKLLEFATAGDYTTPTCPSCGIKMVARTAGKGRSEGSQFWGCLNFPRGCKQTFKIAQ